MRKLPNTEVSNILADLYPDFFTIDTKKKGFTMKNFTPAQEEEMLNEDSNFKTLLGGACISCGGTRGHCTCSKCDSCGEVSDMNLDYCNC